MAVFSTIQKSQLEGAKRLDAEYYQPEYLEWSDRLAKFDLKPLSTLAEKIDVGFVSSMKNEFQAGGIPLLRTQNVQEFYPDLEQGTVYIDESFHKKLKKSQIFPGYVLIARSGSFGAACVVPSRFPTANSADIILIKTKNKLIPEYLTTFLNSKYGSFQIERASSGGLQGHINLYSLEQLLIPLLSLETQKQVKDTVLAGLSLLEESKKIYTQAEGVLLKELGLENFLAKGGPASGGEEETGLWSVVKLSELKKAGRIDPEYFQPKYEKLFVALKKSSPKLLGDLVTMKKGVEPGSEAYTEEGKLFIRVSSISKFGLADKDQKYISEPLYKELKDNYEPKEGEILLTKDASPGVACVLRERIEGVVSGGVMRLKIKEKIDADYLALCINSIVGQYQVERDAGGSIIAHWKPEQIKQVQIPILPEKTQQKIAKLVRESHEARAKAKQLLEDAKHKVEELIESNAK